MDGFTEPGKAAEGSENAALVLTLYSSLTRSLVLVDTED